MRGERWGRRNVGEAAFLTGQCPAPLAAAGSGDDCRGPWIKGPEVFESALRIAGRHCRLPLVPLPGKHIDPRNKTGKDAQLPESGVDRGDFGLTDRLASLLIIAQSAMPTENSRRISGNSKNPAAPIYGGWVRVLSGGSRWVQAQPASRQRRHEFSGEARKTGEIGNSDLWFPISCAIRRQQPGAGPA